jgi:AAA ATPase domain
MYLYHSKLADPASLEKMLFGRREVADWLEKMALLFAESGKATHSLLVGNRGMGKSHVMGTLYHRLTQSELVRKNVVIAYMEEDPYGIADYLDLLRRILKAIALREQDAASKQRLQAAHQTLVAAEPKQRVDTAQRILLEHLAGRRLLLLVENLNQIFEALGEEGQSRWRDFLQANDNTMICATSQAIFSDVQQRTKPFFGFFHVTYLQKLRYEEARDLLLAMAETQKNTELIAYVDTPEGEAKLRAIFELTEGNHRLLVAFFDFFMAEFRSELSKSFLRTVDQLKPYYESFLKLLPTQQQKIVQFLVQERIPQAGRTIADNCFLPINGLSSQMSNLQRLGYVRNDRQGRDAYYEITEPMLRMCLESNENTDGILSIFVDFLGSLYPVQDLKFHLLQFQLIANTVPDPKLRFKMVEEAYSYQKTSRPYTYKEPDTEEVLFVREASPYEQEQTIRRIVEDNEAETYHALPRALQAATKILLLMEDVPTTQLHDFHAALTEAFGHQTSMHYPLKFLHLGVRHVKENDPKALLELTLEERRVFEREILGKVKEDETQPEGDFPK